MATAAGRGAPESLCSAKPVACTQDKLRCQAHSATLIEAISKRQGGEILLVVQNRSCKGFGNVVVMHACEHNIPALGYQFKI